MALEKGRLDKLSKILKGMNEPIRILNTQVDPDAIGGSVDFWYLLKHYFKKESQIIYTGALEHPQNKSIINFYALAELMKPVSDLELKDDEGLGDVILIDSSLMEDDRLSVSFNPVVVIDHHSGSDLQENDNNWILIDSSVGASATLVGELMQAFEVEPQDDEEGQKIATIGALGIASDTLNFTLGDTKRDREIWNWLKDHGLAEDYAKLSHYDYSKRYYQLLNQVTNKSNITKISDTVLIVRTGMVTKDEVAFLSNFADLFFRHEGIKTVFVWAPIKDVGLAIKVRTKDSSENLIDMIIEIFGTGGAKSKKSIGAGGATITLPKVLVPTDDNAKKAIAFFDQCMQKKIKDYLGHPKE